MYEAGIKTYKKYEQIPIFIKLPLAKNEKISKRVCQIWFQAPNALRKVYPRTSLVKGYAGAFESGEISRWTSFYADVSQG